MELEFHQMEMKYASLSIIEHSAQARLMASLAQQGQQNPVLVIRKNDAEKYVLIDGYRRVKGLIRLGCDTVWATVMEMDEISALVYKHSMESRAKRTAIEDSWLIMELIETHGLSQEETGIKLGKSASWVSRRLALVSVLSTKIQALIRKGKISPQAGMKYLVPLARANSEECEQLVLNLGSGKLSVREMRKVYMAWKKAGPDKRCHVVENPRLYARVYEELSQSSDKQEQAGESECPLLKDVRIIKSVSLRATGHIRKGITPAQYIRSSWEEAVIAFQKLNDYMRRHNHEG